MIDKIENCCDVAVSALDGLYGWGNEVIAIVLFVFVFNFILKRFLKKLHEIFKRQQKVWKDSFVDALYKPLSYYVWFVAAIQILNLIAWEVSYDLSTDDRHMVLSIGALLAFSWFLLRWKTFIVRHMKAKSLSKEIVFDVGKIAAIDKILTIAIIFFFILMLLEVSHRSMNTIIAFGGVGGLALAFASQEIIANFFGGFMIYMTQPFTINDWIIVPDHNIEGIVEDIGWYMTRVRSLDKRPIYIPNAIFSKLIVITPSRMSHRQIKTVIQLRYEDLPKMKAVLHDFKEALEQNLDLDRTQSMGANLSALGANSLEVTISAYSSTIDQTGYFKIRENVLFDLTAVMEKHKVESVNSNVQVNLNTKPLENQLSKIP